MYRTCLFCQRDMGANAVLETLPIGRRVAFDSGQGRLWVICRGCERWNLVPFDSRLETIDACERSFRESRTRYSTDNIGIARLREGLELVRVGPALRPELAAWRYGDQFGRRRRKVMLIAGGTVLGVGGIVTLGITTGVSLMGFGGLLAQIPQMAFMYHGHARLAMRLPLGDGSNAAMSHLDIASTKLRRAPDGAMELAVQGRRGHVGKFFRVRDATPKEHVLRGDDMRQALRQLTPRVNANGAPREAVQFAVGLLDTHSFEQLLQRGEGSKWHAERKGRYQHLAMMHRPQRLALEMLLHEESERDALAGDLKLLERQWREAEKVAAIADALALPVAPTSGSP